MTGIGPALPPHLLAKRKRQLEESTEDDTPSASGAKRQKSPSEPEKRARVIGPAPPPAPLDERPAIGPDEDDESSSSSDDDCFGPALPTGPVIDINDEAAGDRSTHLLEEQKVSRRSAKRDEWMMVPPKQDDLAARLDPTKLRARGFNTGKGAKGPAGGGGDSAMWTETPEQKLKRLQNEAMGVKTVQEPSGRDERGQSKAKDEETDRRIREHTEKTRGKSLYEQHQKTFDRETEDDPSKRAFDREKDMAAGSRIGQAQKKEMLNKAAGFSSRFSSGSYL